VSVIPLCWTHLDRRCHASVEEIAAALTGNWREEHVFALAQALELYETYQSKIAACDSQTAAVLARMKNAVAKPVSRLPPARHRDRTANAPAFDARAALHAIVGVDLTQIHGLGPSLALKLVGECGTDLSAWPDAKHFTSWLCLAPSNKISGGKVLSTRTRRSGNRDAALLRLAAVTVGRTETALGAFYRRLSARVGKAKAVTATARKIVALFYNTLRHGMTYADPGASYYEERYRARVLGNLQRRAKSLGYVLQEAPV
jgi:transposase